MKVPLVLLLAVFGASPALGQQPMDGPSLLFKNRGKQLSAIDKKGIFDQLELNVAANGKRLEVRSCGEVDMEVRLVDLNKDKVPEVFVHGGNVCTSGTTGSRLWLFVKDSSGAFRMNLGFPAAAYKILKEGSKGFPDLRFGATGFCDGIWRWNGTNYRPHRNQPTAEGGCDGRGPAR